MDWTSLSDTDDPCSIADLRDVDFTAMPTDASIWVMDDNFPDVNIASTGSLLACQITEHIYSKFWWHKFSAGAFSNAMIRAVMRLGNEGHPLSDPSLESDDDIHIFVRWSLTLPLNSSGNAIAEAVRAAFDLVWARADAILEDSDSVLILGKDTDDGMLRLKSIAGKLESMGYYPYIIKEQPDKLGESVVQKVLRYALSSKFVMIENSEASGHLYEIPHVTKLAECVTAVLQEDGRGSTWMFEDAYAKHNHWQKFTYASGSIDAATEDAVRWCEHFLEEFADYQKKHLPWM